MAAREADELGIGTSPLRGIAGDAANVAAEVMPGWTGAAVRQLLRSVTDGADRRAAEGLETARRRARITPTAFAHELATDDRFQEILYQALQTVVWTGDERKRHRAAYVLGDAVAGNISIDEALLRAKTVAALDEAHWAMFGLVLRMLAEDRGKDGSVSDDELRAFASEIAGQDFAERFDPLVGTLVSHGILREGQAWDGRGLRLSEYAHGLLTYVGASAEAER